MKFSTDGLIIGEMSLGERDRVVTVLTRKKGVIRAFVKGVASLKTPKSGATRLLCYSDIVVYEGKDKLVIDSAESKEMFMPLRLDIEKMALAQYFCQLIGELAPSQTTADDYLRLILNSLYILCKGTKANRLIKAVFELRLMAMSGYMPDLVACSSCGKFEDENMVFLPDNGTLLCSECNKENGMRCLHTGVGATAAMRHAIYAPPEKLYSFNITGQGLREFSKSAEEYILKNLDKIPQTLSFYNTIATENNDE